VFFSPSAIINKEDRVFTGFRSRKEAYEQAGVFHCFSTVSGTPRQKRRWGARKKGMVRMTIKKVILQNAVSRTKLLL